MEDVFIVSAARTPVGKRNGYLREWEPALLLGQVIDEVIDRIDLDPELVEDVMNGTVYQVGEQGFVLGRLGVLASKRLPDTVPGMSMNRQCGSSLTAIQLATGMIATGVNDVIICSGCELLTKYPIPADINGTLFNGNPMGTPYTDWYLEKYGPADQILSAHLIAEKWGITAEECQKFAVASHANAQAATDKGYFKNEIMPITGIDKEGKPITRTTDESIRPQTSMEGLQALTVLPKTKFLTAGISSSITDGASAVVLMSGKKMKELNLKPLARVVASATVGADVTLMLTGPLYVTPKVLKKAGLTMNDIDLFEVNEAFAPIPLAWAKELSADMSKLNVNGGAIALGHPVGNSGCRLTVTAINELRRRNGKYALVTLCTGGGMAPATIFELC